MRENSDVTTPRTVRRTPVATRAVSTAGVPRRATPSEAMAVRPATTSAAAFEPRERSEFACRALNLAAALALLVLSSPIMVITAVLIWLTSRGPVFYTQTRVGLDRRWNRTHALRDRRAEDLGGTPFAIYKFRSMRLDAESNGEAVWAAKNDDRITAVGRVIRKVRIDELPQVFNVLRGEMNIVGPRPERPSIFVRLREQLEDYPVRQRVRPGITGLAQVSHAYDSSIEDVRRKVEFDVAYMSRQSLWYDVGIMFRTIPVMLFGVGSR